MNINFYSCWLTILEIEPRYTVSATDALCTRPLIGNYTRCMHSSGPQVFVEANIDLNFIHSRFFEELKHIPLVTSYFLHARSRFAHKFLHP